MNSSLQLTERAQCALEHLGKLPSIMEISESFVVGAFFKALQDCADFEAAVGVLRRLPKIIKNMVIDTEALEFLIALASCDRFEIQREALIVANKIFSEYFRCDFGQRQAPWIDLLTVKFCAECGRDADKSVHKICKDAIERQFGTPGVGEEKKDDPWCWWHARTDIHELIIKAFFNTGQIFCLIDTRYQPIIPAFKSFVAQRQAKMHRKRLSKVLKADDLDFLVALEREIKDSKNWSMDHRYIEDLKALLYLMKMCRD